MWREEVRSIILLLEWHKMKLTRNQKIGFGLAGVALATIGGIALQNHFRAVAIVKDLNDYIAKDINPEGTSADLRTHPAFDPNYWKTISAKKLPTVYLKTAEARAYAKEFYDDIGYTYDNETDIVTAIQKLRNWVQLSQISYYFADQYKQNLGDFLVAHVDKGTNLSDIARAVSKMPVA